VTRSNSTLKCPVGGGNDVPRFSLSTSSTRIRLFPFSVVQLSRQHANMTLQNSPLQSESPAHLSAWTFSNIIAMFTPVAIVSSITAHQRSLTCSPIAKPHIAHAALQSPCSAAHSRPTLVNRRFLSPSAQKDDILWQCTVDE
jgi:hypothetical protein